MRAAMTMGLLLLALVATAILPSCSNNPEVTAADSTIQDLITTTTVATTSEPAAPTTSVPDADALGENARQYFEDLTARRTTFAAEAGSYAELYAQYFRTIGEAQASIYGTEQITMSIDGSTVKLGGSAQTTAYDDIVVSAEGVRSFTIDGNELSARLTTSPAVEADPISVEHLINYHAASGLLITTFVASNSSDQNIALNLWTAEYVDANGRQVQIQEALGPNNLRPGATASFALVWPSTTQIGTLYFEAYNADDIASPGIDFKIDFTSAE